MENKETSVTVIFGSKEYHIKARLPVIYVDSAMVFVNSSGDTIARFPKDSAGFVVKPVISSALRRKQNEEEKGTF